MAIDGYRSWNPPWYYDLHTHHWQVLQNCFAFSRNWLQSLPQSSLCSRWRVMILGWMLTITLILILILIMILILVLSTVCHCVCFQKLNQAHWQRFCCVKDNLSFDTSSCTGSQIILMIILVKKSPWQRVCRVLARKSACCSKSSHRTALRPGDFCFIFLFPFFVFFLFFCFFFLFLSLYFFVLSFSFFVCYLLCPWLGVCKWELPESSPPSLAPSFVYNNISFVFLTLFVFGCIWKHLFLMMLICKTSQHFISGQGQTVKQCVAAAGRSFFRERLKSFKLMQECAWTRLLSKRKHVFMTSCK